MQHETQHGLLSSADCALIGLHSLPTCDVRDTVGAGVGWGG